MSGARATGSRRLMVVDGFYPSPAAVRRVALRRRYVEPEEITGWRTRPHHPPGVRRLIERRFGVRITQWDDDPNEIVLANGVFFAAFSTGAKAEPVGVHADDPPTWITLLVYLTPDAPLDTGTSFWRHRATGLRAWPTAGDARRLGVSLETLRQRLDGDSQYARRWEEIDRVGNVFNRAVFYPGGRFHSASRHFGRSVRDGRLYQLFHFPVAAR